MLTAPVDTVSLTAKFGSHCVSTRVHDHRLVDSLGMWRLPRTFKDLIAMIFNDVRYRDVTSPVILVSCSYDRDAPTRVGAKHTPSLVLILCTDFVRGLTHAASRVSRVVKPYRHGIVYKRNAIGKHA